jgi:hypothetical protein
MRTSPTFSAALTAAAVVALVATAGTVSTADASAGGDRAAAPTTIAKGLFSPLSAAIGPGGTAYVAQNFAGTIARVEKSAKPKTVFKVKKEGDEAGAVSLRKGVLTFAITEADGGAVVKQISKKGKVRTLANVKRYEATQNPDGDVTYGIEGIAEECAAQFPAEGFPAVYPGIVESHPYATTTNADGRTFVADAAGNSILGISRSGAIRTVAVLPPVPVEVTTELAETLGFPECSVGETYDFEPVPTDVEVGPGGRLYVSTLPGGPEDGSAGPLAAVYQVNPRTGGATLLAGGLVSAVGVAVGPSGTVYVSQLFAGTIAKIRGGTTTTFASAAMPGDVEVRDGSVYATVNVLSGMSGEPGDVPNGKLVRFKG